MNLLLKKIKANAEKLLSYLKQDSWHSWLVSLLLIYLFIKLIFFPALSLLTGSPLPLVVVESCSMYHESDFDEWWNISRSWYLGAGITKEDFRKFAFKNGLNKGDIILVKKSNEYETGEILIFGPNMGASAQNPTIHRKISNNPTATKGDNNFAQLTPENNIFNLDETNIDEKRIIGKTFLRIPLAGWTKLIWFEPFRPKSERGLCEQNQKLNILG